MWKLILAGLAALLLLASILLWMLRPGARLEEGSRAPEFALPDQDGISRALSDYAGHWLVLYFYPRDHTPLCTREACHFRKHFDTLKALGATVIGVSVNSVPSHLSFARKHRLPFPLLSDTGGRIARAYGSLLNLGIARFARRRTFIIDPAGRIAARFDRVDPADHAEEVARVLRDLQRSKTTPTTA